VGSDVSLAAWFMTSAVVGGAIAQWPLGILSDRVGRRAVLIAISLCGSAVGVALFLAAPVLQFWSANVLALLWGALAFPLYTIAVAYANDYADPSEYVTVSAGLLLMYGLGATAGPFVASALMTEQNSGGLFAFSATVHFALVVFVAVRVFRGSSVAEQQIAFGDALSAAQTKSQVYEEEIQQQSENNQEPI
jgi:MFS family permease